MPAQWPVLDFHARPAAMTSAGAHAPAFHALPGGVAALVCVVQGLLLHEHFAPAYGQALSDERRSEAHIRPVELMLDRLLARDGRPLAVGRDADARLVGVCPHFSVLLAAMLRAAGVSARACCGFASYFNRGSFEDHWVCERWDADGGRWVLVDAQMDGLQRATLGLDFDPLDVPRDRFLVAGEAWARCRAGRAEPAAFGIFDLRGLWFVAGNVIRDAAALNDAEMLPWDVWGAMPHPDDPMGDDLLAFLDRLAALTREPDEAFAELRALYEGDTRLRVPAIVHNAKLDRPEAV